MKGGIDSHGIRAARNFWVPLLPLAGAIAIVPLISWLINIPLGESSQVQWKSISYLDWAISKVISPGPQTLGMWPYHFDANLFTFWKAFWIVVFSAIATVLWVWLCIRRSTNKTSLVIDVALALMAVSYLVSSIFSIDPSVALFGFPGRNEGLLVLLGYLVLCKVTFSFPLVFTQKKFLIYALFLSAGVICCFGFVQYVFVLQGQERLPAALGNFLIPRSYRAAYTVEIDFGSICSTLIHKDYVGSYVALVLPIVAIFAIKVTTIWKKIILTALGGSLLALLLISESRAGLIATTIALAALFAYLSGFFHKPGVRRTVILLVLALSSILSVWLLQINSVAERSSQRNLLVDIYSEDSDLIIRRELDSIVVRTIDQNLKFFDGAGIEIPQTITQNGSTIEYGFRQGMFSDVVFQFDPSTKKVVMKSPQIFNHPFAFLIDGNVFKYMTVSGMSVSIPKIEKYDIPLEQLKPLSARIYIWSRSAPLLHNSVFLGLGPGGFFQEFPQSDAIGKAVAYDGTQVIVDKPHNFYIETWINGGSVALLAFLVIVTTFLVGSYKSFFVSGKSHGTKHHLGIGITLGIVGYLAAALGNDSVVAVAPVFWILLGIGISLLKKNGVFCNTPRRSLDKNP